MLAVIQSLQASVDESNKRLEQHLGCVEEHLNEDVQPRTDKTVQQAKHRIETRLTARLQLERDEEQPETSHQSIDQTTQKPVEKLAETKPDALKPDAAPTTILTASLSSSLRPRPIRPRESADVVEVKYNKNTYLSLDYAPTDDPMTQQTVRSSESASMASDHLTSLTPSETLYSSKYNVLSGTNSIRLLHIQAVTEFGHDDEPIICGLSPVNLDDRPVFHALSYVWGIKSVKPKVVHCNGSMVEVTDNCYSALLHIRKRYGSLRIWIDALCINQDDTREKESQIILMGQIYATSEQVIIWLGAGTAASDRAMTYMSNTNVLETSFRAQHTTRVDVYKATLKIYMRRWDLRNHAKYIKQYRSQPRESPDHLPPSSYLAPERAIVEGLQDLLSREWIHRIWTYQEIILANNPVIICGDCMITWTQFNMRLITLYFIARQDRTVARLASALANWKEVGLMKDQLSCISSPESDIPKRSWPLHKYQLFVHKIAWLMLRARNVARLLATTTAITTIVFIGSYLDCLQRERQVGQRPITAPDGSLLEWPGCGPRFNWPIVTLSTIVVLLVLNHISSRWSGQSFTTPYANEDPVFTDSEADLVDAICFRHARNPKDKVFGLHGILEVLLGEKPPLPDYRRPLQELYKELALQVCQASTKTQVLTAAADFQLVGGPSWVPDWSSPFSAFWLQPEFTQGSLNSATPSHRSHQFKYVVEATDDIMKVLGKCLCRIDDCRELQKTADTYEICDDEKHLHNLDIMAQLFDTRYGFNKKRKISRCNFNPLRDRSLPKELVHLITDPGIHPDLISGVNELDLEDYLIFLRRYYHLDRHVMLRMLKSSQSMRSQLCLSFELYRQVPYAHIFRAHIAICNSISAAGRKLFSTTSCVRLSYEQSYSSAVVWRYTRNLILNIGGRQLVRGVCNSPVQVGDEVILVAGNHMPLVIRRGGSDTVRLVSPAIVFGVMQGQAWPSLDHIYAGGHEGFIKHLETFRIS